MYSINCFLSLKIILKNIQTPASPNTDSLIEDFADLIAPSSVESKIINFIRNKPFFINFVIYTKVNIFYIAIFKMKSQNMFIF